MRSRCLLLGRDGRSWRALGTKGDTSAVAAKRHTNNFRGTNRYVLESRNKGRPQQENSIKHARCGSESDIRHQAKRENYGRNSSAMSGYPTAQLD